MLVSLCEADGQLREPAEHARAEGGKGPLGLAPGTCWA